VILLLCAFRGQIYKFSVIHFILRNVGSASSHSTHDLFWGMLNLQLQKDRSARSRHNNAMKCVSHSCYTLMKQHSSIRSATSIEISRNWTDWVDRSKIQNPLDTQIQAETLSWFLSTSSLRSKFIEFVWPKVVGCMACRHSNPGRRPIFCYSDASDASIRRQHATKDASHKTFPSTLFHSSVSPPLPPPLQFSLSSFHSPQNTDIYVIAL